ncbi:MAG TPA: hypothetical protein VG796_30945 [Verrucomicrobiales bacterium]|nr:hypothetical protein [Verrucomicrobiales bacterium]
MKTFRLLFTSLLSLHLAFTAIAANPLAIGPDGVDADDRTGDAADTWTDARSVWTGTHGVAVWTTWSTNPQDYEDTVVRIVGVRFGAGGERLGEPVALVESSVGLSSTGKSISLSISGNELLLVWQNITDGVLARRLAPDLTWLDPQPSVLIPRGPLEPHDVYRLESTGNATHHGVVLHPFLAQPSTLTFVRLGSVSSPTLETVHVNIPNGEWIRSADVAARASGFLIAWEGQDQSGACAVQACTTGLVGNATGPLQTIMARGVTGFDTAPDVSVSVVAFGEGYAAAWSSPQYNGSSIIGDYPRMWRRLDATGSPATPAQELFPVDPSQQNYLFLGAHPVVLQSFGSGLLALSSITVPGGAAPFRRMIVRTIAADGTAGPVTDFGEVQAMVPEMIDIHNTGSGAVAVGNVRAVQIHSDRRAIVASKLASGGTWNPSSHLLSLGIPEQQACAVASGGTDFLVVWQDGRDGHTLASEIRGRRFSIDGVPLGPSFRISNSPGNDISPAVAASNGNYLVAWTENRWDDPNEDIKAARIIGTDNIVPFSVAALPDRQENGVSIAGGVNGGFFVAWRSGPTAGTLNRDDIHGAWITAGGSVVPENGFPVGVSSQRERAVAVAGGPSTYGIVWRTGNSEASSVYGAIVPGAAPASPVLPDVINIAVGGNSHAPEIIWNGASYSVVWREVSTRRIHSVPVSSAGVVGTRTTIAESNVNLFEPAIAPGPVGGGQIFWFESIQRGQDMFGFTTEMSVNFATVDAVGQPGPISRFAPRYADRDTLAAARGGGGGILIVYPTPQGWGKEPQRTGGLERVFLYPNRLAPEPQFSITGAGAYTTLRWKVDPYYPRDAGLIESSPNLLQWSPVLQFPFIVTAEGTGNDAIASFPSLPGTRQFFRLNSSVPGSLIVP